jgi:voltage-gated potassium channel
VRRRLVELLYSPTAEWIVLVLIVLSVLLLTLELAGAQSGPVGWLGAAASQERGGWFFWFDVVLSAGFAVEYFSKLWLAPRKWHFVSRHLIDLLAILPVLRVFRIGRVVRLLRLFRLLRVMRVGALIGNLSSPISEDARKYASENLTIITYLVFSMVFGTLGVMVFEKGADSGFDTLGDSIWWCVVTITTVGYGDRSPVTFGGRLVAMTLMFIGLSFYALLTGVMSSLLIERSRRKETQTMDINSLKDHVVICGYNSNAPRLIRDLRSAQPDTSILVISERTGVALPADPLVLQLELDPTTEAALERAQVDFASAVIMLGDDALGRSGHDADARSILTTLAVESRNPKLHTIVELLNDANVPHARNAGADEVVVSGAYTGTMLSQSAQSPGVSDVYRDLFRPGAGSAVVEEDVPTQWHGRAYSELVSAWVSEGLGAAIGYRRDGVVVLAPGVGVMLQPGDRAVLIRSVGDD